MDKTTEGKPSSPLVKTTKRRTNASHPHRSKDDQRGRGNSTDDEEQRAGTSSSRDNQNSQPTPLQYRPSASASNFRSSKEDPAAVRKPVSESLPEDLTNNEDGPIGFIDSENDDCISDRLSCLSKLSLHTVGVAGIVGEESPFDRYNNGVKMRLEGEGPDVKSQLHSVPISKIRNPSYQLQLQESDSVTDTCSRVNMQVVQSSSGCCPGATTGDGPSEDKHSSSSGSRFRRRRRRRGHNPSSKRMAVDASPGDDDGDCRLHEKLGYSIRAAERPGPSSALSRKPNKLEKVKPDIACNKRKRTVPIGIPGEGNKSSLDLEDVDVGDVVANLSLNSPEDCMDQDMKSDDDDSYSSDSADEDEGGGEDRGGEGDDEQSDWVFDEWSTKDKKSHAEALCSRKKRLLKMLKSYNEMIAANASGGDDSISKTSSREIRAGKRRVHVGKSGFPTTSFVTSANEEVSKFLQNPLQSQLRLQAKSVEEGLALTQLASLYSLRMDYQPNEDLMDDTTRDQDDGLLVTVLTKTPNTTQMDSHNNEPPIASPVNAEGSSSSNLSSVYGPIYSDVDVISDSKRFKK